MKRYILLLFLVVFLCGCMSNQTADKSITINKPYDEVSTKTIRFLTSKGWSISDVNKEAKTLQAVISEYAGEKDTLSLVFTPIGDSTEVYIKSFTGMSYYQSFNHNPTQIIDEYVDYINKE